MGYAAKSLGGRSHPSNLLFRTLSRIRRLSHPERAAGRQQILWAEILFSSSITYSPPLRYTYALRNLFECQTCGSINSNNSSRDVIGTRSHFLVLIRWPRTVLLLLRFGASYRRPKTYPYSSMREIDTPLP